MWSKKSVVINLYLSRYYKTLKLNMNFHIKNDIFFSPFGLFWVKLSQYCDTNFTQVLVWEKVLKRHSSSLFWFSHLNPLLLTGFFVMEYEIFSEIILKCKKNQTQWPKMGSFWTMVAKFSYSVVKNSLLNMGYDKNSYFKSNEK